MHVFTDRVFCLFWSLGAWHEQTGTYIKHCIPLIIAVYRLELVKDFKKSITDMLVLSW